MTPDVGKNNILIYNIKIYVFFQLTDNTYSAAKQKLENVDDVSSIMCRLLVLLGSAL